MSENGCYALDSNHSQFLDSNSIDYLINCMYLHAYVAYYYHKSFNLNMQLGKQPNDCKN